jgi:hypothetical protein
VVSVNIKRADVQLWPFKIVLSLAPTVVNLLSLATKGVRDRCNLAVCIFLVEWDAKTELYKHRPISYL